MPQSRVLTPQDYLGMLRRRWHLVVIPAIAGLALGVGLTQVLPKRYTSQALMLVERQRVSHDLVEPIINEDLNARIANIEEQTLSRTRLQPIIERYGLFKKAAANQSMDGLVLMLQNAITLTPVKPVVRTRDETIPGFYLSVTLDDPRNAQQVCADVTSMFVDEDIRQRQRTAEGTTTFLQSQLDDAKRKLDDQDAILANFERKYMGMLPDETQTNLAMLGTLNTQLQTATDNLNRVIQNKAYMESVLAQQLQAWNLTKEMEGGAGTAPPDSPAVRLARLQENLQALEALYTDQFPDVVRVKAQIADLKKQIAAATDKSKAKGGTDGASLDSLEPPDIQKTRGQIHALEQAVKAGTKEEEQLKASIHAYEARLRLSPAIEEEYKKITRDHETALKFYNLLLARRDQSEMATDLERRQEGEQLRVMDPANLPEAPSFPNPAAFIGGGAAAGLALGLALVLGLGRSDNRIRTGRDVQFYLGTTTFALIPSIKTVALMAGNGQNPAKKKGRKTKELVGT